MFLNLQANRRLSARSALSLKLQLVRCRARLSDSAVFSPFLGSMFYNQSNNYTIPVIKARDNGSGTSPVREAGPAKSLNERAPQKTFHRSNSQHLRVDVGSTRCGDPFCQERCMKTSGLPWLDPPLNIQAIK